MALQLSKQVVYAIVHQHTSVDADEAAALPVYEPQCPVERHTVKRAWLR